MNLIIKEYKKLFTVKTIALAVIIAILSYFLFISFNINYLSMSPQHEAKFEFAKKLIGSYGAYIDAEEIENLKVETQECKENLNKFIKSNKELSSYGVTNYQEFKKLQEESLDSTNSNEGINSALAAVYKNENYKLLENSSEILENYYKSTDDESIMYEYQNSNAKEIERVKESRGNVKNKAPLDYGVLRNYESLVIGILILIGIEVFLIVSPIFLSDKNKKIDQIQYSTKIGKKIYKTKIISSYLAAITIATFIILIIGYMYKAQGFLVFWNCSINSELMGAFVRWYDLTFGQFIILTIILVYIFALTIASVSMWISAKVDTYIALLGGNIVVVAVLIFMGFMGIDFFATIGPSKYLQFFIWASMIVIIIIMNKLTLRIKN